MPKGAPGHGTETDRARVERYERARFAALTPPPKRDLIRYHGMPAPNAKLRKVVIKQVKSGCSEFEH